MFSDAIMSVWCQQVRDILYSDNADESQPPQSKEHSLFVQLDILCHFDEYDSIGWKEMARCVKVTKEKQDNSYNYHPCSGMVTSHAFGHICLYVCVYVIWQLSRALNPWPIECSFLVCRYIFRKIQVKFVCQGCRIKVKVTTAKKLKTRVAAFDWEEILLSC